MADCIVCDGELREGQEVSIFPASIKYPKGGRYHTRTCGNGSIPWLEKFGVTVMGRTYIYMKKGGVGMDDPCPEFGTGYSEQAKECKACVIILPTYAKQCKDELIKNGGDPNMSEKEKKPKKEKVAPAHAEKPEKEKKPKKAEKAEATERKPSNVDVCIGHMKAGKSKEDIVRILKKQYTDAGKDDAYAEGRANSIYRTAQAVSGKKK